MNNSWEDELIDLFEKLFSDTMTPHIETIEGRRALVLEPVTDDESFAEDFTVTVQTYSDITTVGILAAVFSELDDGRTEGIGEILAARNSLLRGGSFRLIGRYVFFDYTYVIDRELETDPIVRVFVQSLDTVSVTVGQAKVIMLPFVHGKLTAEKVINGETVIFQ